MKKIILILSTIAILSSCSDDETTNECSGNLKHAKYYNNGEFWFETKFDYENDKLVFEDDSSPNSLIKYEYDNEDRFFKYSYTSFGSRSLAESQISYTYEFDSQGRPFKEIFINRGVTTRLGQESNFFYEGIKTLEYHQDSVYVINNGELTHKLVLNSNNRVIEQTPQNLGVGTTRITNTKYEYDFEGKLIKVIETEFGNDVEYDFLYQTKLNPFYDTFLKFNETTYLFKFDNIWRFKQSLDDSGVFKNLIMENDKRWDFSCK